MYETIGERICYCRNLLNLSQREFAIAFDISKPTITRWESNSVKIPANQINVLVEKFKKYGILVSTKWLLTGVDTPPINENAAELHTLNFDEITYITLNNLKLKIKNFEIFQITNKFFEPILGFADYVAGIPSENKISINGKFCFVITNKDVTVGIYNHTDQTIKNIFEQVYPIKDKILTIGEVLWIAKRF